MCQERAPHKIKLPVTSEKIKVLRARAPSRSQKLTFPVFGDFQFRLLFGSFLVPFRFLFGSFSVPFRFLFGSFSVPFRFPGTQTQPPASREVKIGSFSVPFRFLFGSFSVPFRFLLGSFSAPFRLLSGSFSAPFRLLFGSFSAPFRLRFVPSGFVGTSRYSLFSALEQRALAKLGMSGPCSYNLTGELVV